MSDSCLRDCTIASNHPLTILRRLNKDLEPSCSASARILPCHHYSLYFFCQKMDIVPLPQLFSLDISMQSDTPLFSALFSEQMLRQDSCNV